ncbi:hypothetical protein VNI00_005265 [Paramarasmius palmivorus]|uniref:Xylose isomerase-like TIM barrel domain-containing protein n=1 Tax=Paramarasmius palmivorus TaxID=297713 RepID=A0AAW0DDX4_9AGAR
MTRPKFAIASLSLGTNTHHTLPTKIRVASELEYDGIEIFMPDFEVFVEEVRKGGHKEIFSMKVKEEGLETLSQDQLEHRCAEALYDLCAQHNLQIPLLQPLRDFENFASEEELSTALEGAERWFRLMQPMHCDLVLVCSNYVPSLVQKKIDVDAYLDRQVEAFKRLGELAERYNVRVGYEPLAWGTVVDNWEPVWDVVKRVDRSNVGVVLDSFNTLGNQYADPGESSCVRRDMTLQFILENLEKMCEMIPAEKVFFYQIADAVRPKEVCVDDLTQGMPKRMKWSRACRVFPCEPSSPSTTVSSSSSPDSETYLGFLPVPQMTSLIHHKLGYRGWWSLEVFNTSLQEPDEECTWRHGKRGIRGLEKLWDVVNVANTDPKEDRGQISAEQESESGSNSDSSRSTSTPSTPNGSDIDVGLDISPKVTSSGKIHAMFRSAFRRILRL